MEWDFGWIKVELRYPLNGDLNRSSMGIQLVNLNVDRIHAKTNRFLD